MNQVILVGRLVRDPRDEGDGRLTLAISRSYKNADGVYETDFIPCRMWGNMAETTMEYCRKGDVIGVKGRLQSTNLGGQIEVVAEKVTFLSSKSSMNDERDDD